MIHEQINKTIDGIASMLLSIFFGAITVTQIGSWTAMIAGVISAVGGTIAIFYYREVFLETRERRVEKHLKEMAQITEENLQLKHELERVKELEK